MSKPITQTEKAAVLRPKKKVVWTIAEARALILRLEVALLPVGAHVALAGSVLHTGESKKDLDIIVYPRSSRYFDIERIREVFDNVGLRCIISAAEVRRDWRKRGIKDGKRVEIWAERDRRVDVLFLK